MRRVLPLALLLAGIGHAKDAGATPRGYAFVAFGVKEQRRTLLVAEGGALLVDRNGDGDASDAGERIGLDDLGRFATDVAACDEEGREGTYRVYVTLAPGGDGIKALHVHPVGDIQAFHATAGFIPLATKPEDAPVIPIDGPFRFVLMDHWTGETKCRVLPRAGGEHEFSILVATPVKGIKGEAYLYPNLYPLQREELPTIRVEFEPKDGSGVVAPRLEVWQCECARRYRCKLTVPPAEKTARATLFLSFPGWRHGKLEPARFDLPYADAN